MEIQPNSRENLKKGRKINEDLARSYQKKSAESRRAKASLKEALEEGITEETAKLITKVLIEKAIHGNLKAYELIRDGIGEKPTDKVEHVNDIIIDFGNLTEGD